MKKTTILLVTMLLFCSSTIRCETLSNIESANINSINAAYDSLNVLVYNAQYDENRNDYKVWMQLASQYLKRGNDISAYWCYDNAYKIKIAIHKQDPLTHFPEMLITLKYLNHLHCKFNQNEQIKKDVEDYNYIYSMLDRMAPGQYVPMIANFYMNIGIHYTNVRQYEASVFYYSKAINFYDDSKVEDGEFELEKGDRYLVLVLGYLYRGRDYMHLKNQNLAM